MIQIEKNVPLPKKRKPGRIPKYPFAEMKAGDSFVVETDDADKEVKRLLAAGASWASRNGKKVSFTAEAQNGGSVRVWMIERKRK